ncbi:hypothetical protein CSUI_011159, partial [Cystoisospora suis]
MARQGGSSSSADDSIWVNEGKRGVCYYELLEIERSSSLNEIKKAFRKKALQLHPDKNSDRVEEATRLFQQLQEAYECLSNPQERAWYDAHRDQILGRRGGGRKKASSSSFSDDDDGVSHGMKSTSLDLWIYFSSSCYSGFKDEDEESFWSVYTHVFSTLLKEEQDEVRRNRKGTKEDEEAQKAVLER